MSRRRDEAGAIQLSDAAQAYLLALRAVTDGAGTTLTSALAREMGVSTQAASEMVGRLAAEGLVHVSEDRELSLTAGGRAAADTIFRRHSLMEWLLTRVVGLGWAESDEEAMRLQGAVSPRVEAAVAALLGDPPTCPHGNPISAEAAARRPRGVPLSEVAAGERITIYRITERAEEDKALLHDLEEQALVPGARATVVEVSVARDMLTLDGPRGRSSIGLRPAALIRVLPDEADPGLFHHIPDGIGRPAP